jgi:hypothetical protein
MKTINIPMGVEGDHGTSNDAFIGVSFRHCKINHCHTGQLMRAALTALILSAAGTIIVEDATAQSWCAITNQGAANCGFSTIDLCRAEVSGNGGSCIPEAPVGHRQPRAANVGPLPTDDLDALQDRINKKNDNLILCRGC